jgi:hypothetical protein
MPEEVVVFAIEGTGVETFSEQLSPPVVAASPEFDLVRREASA